MNDVFEIARGRWRGILGQWLTERTVMGKHGPCPTCGGKDRFRLHDKYGRGDSWCNHCGPRSGPDLVMDLMGLDFAEACQWIEGQVGRVRKVNGPKMQKTTDELKSDLRRVWATGQRVTKGDPVWQYLSARCGITAVPDGIRYSPALDYYGDDGERTQHPAMLASVLSADGRCVSIHRTYLTPDGKKAQVKTPRKLMPPSEQMASVAVRLAPVDRGGLAVAEGIETALAYSTIWHAPCWAAVSAGLLEKFNPPEGVQLLVIAADNDLSFTGQASAYKLARRLRLERPEIEVKVHVPIVDGTDFADDYAAREVER